MNRAMRRAAARAKPIGPGKVVPLPKVFDEFAVFNDIDRVLEKIGNGEIEFANGVPVAMSSAGEWYEVIPALNGWISAWKRFNTQFNLNHDLSALVRLCNCLHYGTLVPQSLINSAKAVLAEERRLFKLIDRDALASAAKTEQIALLMEGKAA